MFDNTSEIFEIIRSSIFAYLIIALPIFVSISPCLASKEFPAFRLQQVELHGTAYGTTGSVLNLETRILPGSQLVTSPRRCYIVKLVDLTVSLYKDLVKFSVAGVLIIVPNPQDLETIPEDIREQIYALEQLLLDDSTSIPIYFVVENEDVEEMYETVKKSAESLGSASSGAETLLLHIYGNGVQLSSSLGTPKVMADAQITSIQGSLIGSKAKNFPILITSYYDALSPAAELSFGGDSNGSGTAMLLELARIFSHLYNIRGTSTIHQGQTQGSLRGRPSNSLLFLLSGGGKFAFQGTQKYLEDQIESLEYSDLQDIRLVLCLDSLAGNKNQIYIHVSRSLREGTMLHNFVNNLIDSASQLYPEIKVELIQRKVKTDSLLGWEHEKFHLKKINAITLSSHESSSLVKSSILDTKDKIDIEDLCKKTHIIAEAVAATLYSSTIGSAFSGSLGVSNQSINSLLEYLTSEPRSSQLLATKNNRFVQSLKSILGRYTSETSLFHMKPDKRDGNFVFYDSTTGTITKNDVKPAVFDVVLSLSIAAYLSLIYFAIKSFPKFYEKLSWTLSYSASANGNGGNGQNYVKSKTN